MDCFQFMILFALAFGFMIHNSWASPVRMEQNQTTEAGSDFCSSQSCLSIVSCLEEHNGLDFCSSLMGMSPPTQTSSAETCTTVVEITVVPTVVTSIIYTAPPAATVTATIGVQEIALEELESTAFMTQTSEGIVTHSFASTFTEFSTSWEYSTFYATTMMVQFGSPTTAPVVTRFYKRDTDSDSCSMSSTSTEWPTWLSPFKSDFVSSACTCLVSSSATPTASTPTNTMPPCITTVTSTSTFTRTATRRISSGTPSGNFTVLAPFTTATTTSTSSIISTSTVVHGAQGDTTIQLPPTTTIIITAQTGTTTATSTVISTIPSLPESTNQVFVPSCNDARFLIGNLAFFPASGEGYGSETVNEIGSASECCSLCAEMEGCVSWFFDLSPQWIDLAASMTNGIPSGVTINQDGSLNSSPNNLSTGVEIASNPQIGPVSPNVISNANAGTSSIAVETNVANQISAETPSSTSPNSQTTNGAASGNQVAGEPVNQQVNSESTGTSSNTEIAVSATSGSVATGLQAPAETTTPVSSVGSAESSGSNANVQSANSAATSSGTTENNGAVASGVQSTVSVETTAGVSQAGSVAQTNGNSNGASASSGIQQSSSQTAVGSLSGSIVESETSSNTSQTGGTANGVTSNGGASESSTSQGSSAAGISVSNGETTGSTGSSSPGSSTSANENGGEGVGQAGTESVNTGTGISASASGISTGNTGASAAASVSTAQGSSVSAQSGSQAGSESGINVGIQAGVNTGGSAGLGVGLNALGTTVGTNIALGGIPGAGLSDLTGLSTSGNNILDSTGDAIGNANDLVGNVLGGMPSTSGGNILDMAGGVVGTAANVAGNILSGGVGLGSANDVLGSRLLQDVGGTVENAAGQTFGSVSDLTNQLASSNVVNLNALANSGAQGGLTANLAGSVSGAVSPASGAVNGVVNTANGLVNGAESATAGISGTVGGSVTGETNAGASTSPISVADNPGNTISTASDIGSGESSSGGLLGSLSSAGQNIGGAANEAVGAATSRGGSLGTTNAGTNAAANVNANAGTTPTSNAESNAGGTAGSAATGGLVSSLLGRLKRLFVKRQQVSESAQVSTGANLTPTIGVAQDVESGANAIQAGTTLATTVSIEISLASIPPQGTTVSTAAAIIFSIIPTTTTSPFVPITSPSAVASARNSPLPAPPGMCILYFAPFTGNLTTCPTGKVSLQYPSVNIGSNRYGGIGPCAQYPNDVIPILDQQFGPIRL